jgi:hypothetical protein
VGHLREGVCIGKEQEVERHPSNALISSHEGPVPVSVEEFRCK